MKDLGVVLVAGAVALVGAVAFQFTHPTEDPSETDGDDEVWSCVSVAVIPEDDADGEQVPSPDEVEDLADPATSPDCQPA